MGKIRATDSRSYVACFRVTTVRLKFSSVR